MRCVVDIETDGLNPSRIWCTSVINVDTEESWFFGPDELDKFAELAKGITQWIGHNFLTFDWPVIEKFTPVRIPFPSILDTLILSRLLFTGTVNKHSMEAWGERLATPKQEHEDWSQFSEEMKQRCVSDTWLNLKMYRMFQKCLVNYSPKCVELEHQVQHILNRQKANGFPLNVDSAYAILRECKEKAEAIESEIHLSFPPVPVLVDTYFPRYNKDGTMSKASEGKLSRFPVQKKLKNGKYQLFKMQEFNLGSPKQIVERLNETGWKPTVKTEKGTPKICEENLKTIPDTAPASIRKLVDWWLLRNRCTIIEGWLDAYNPKTGCIHGTCIGIGAITHRMAHYDPQMANIPAIRSEYGEALRACLYAGDDPSYVQLGCDIDGIQLCILAHYLNDPKYTEAIASGVKEKGTDIHSVNRDILKEIVPHVDRDAAKKFIYSMLLGAGGYKLGLDMGVGAKEGQACKDRMFTRIPAFKRVQRMCETAAKRGYMLGIDGRRTPVKSEHFALSVYLQCGEAVVMKQALVYIHERAKHLDWKQMAVVHDEIQARVKAEQAEELGQIMVSAIVDAGKLFQLRCPLSGSYKVGRNWADTH
jgi:DNA polymerase-1